MVDDDFRIPWWEQNGFSSNFGPAVKIDGGSGLPGDCGAAIVADDDRHVIGVFCFSSRQKNYTVASGIPSPAQELDQRGTQVVSRKTVVDRVAKLKSPGFGTGGP
ncbi:hypothetical protein ACGFZP_26590 [Kitasatospora sp. NPDC048239]|uniref:hypothetical protein n=1 Tax=Kitasatospora sp. NPDC048239 TaxID=3364046 RepID=UPI00370FA86F